MKIGFLGDLSFYEADTYPSIFNNFLVDITFELVVSLETPFGKSSFKSTKPKRGLYQSKLFISHLKNLNPYLINLSNNHINDFGNASANYTKKLLDKNNLKYFGAGYIIEEHNIFVDSKNKLLFLSYTERDAEETMSSLFNLKDLQGPKRFSEELFLKQINRYKNYKKVVLMHWGAENVDMPSPNQRITAMNLVDLGADLIIGNHSHRIQGYEKYKNKYIFYSLGNFYFPLHLNKGIKNCRSIVPVFDFNEDIRLIEVKAYYFSKSSVEECNVDINRYLKLFKYDEVKYKKVYNKNKILNILGAYLK